MASRQINFRRKKETSTGNKKKKRTLDSVTELLALPIEVIMEILSRLPVDSLLRCKCVCKEWLTIIQDKDFIAKHLSRGTVGTFCYTNSRKTFDIDGTNETLTYKHHCDGLLLEQNKSSLKYRIRNASTRQVLDLPDPHEHVYFISISFIPSTRNYILVCLYCGYGESQNGGLEVLSLGSDDLFWKELNYPKLYDLKRRETVLVISFDGVYYCFRLVKNVLGDSEVVCLDLVDERFTNFDVPHWFFSEWGKIRAIYWNGKVALVNIEEQELIAWVLEDYKQQRWAEKKIVIPLKFLKENPNLKESLVLYSANKSILWFYVDYDRMMSYDIETEEVTFTVSAPEAKKILYLDFPSLLTLKGMRPENE